MELAINLKPESSVFSEWVWRRCRFKSTRGRMGWGLVLVDRGWYGLAIARAHTHRRGKCINAKACMWPMCEYLHQHRYAVMRLWKGQLVGMVYGTARLGAGHGGLGAGMERHSQRQRFTASRLCGGHQSCSRPRRTDREIVLLSLILLPFFGLLFC